MTVNECLKRFDSEKHNIISKSLKLIWINQLEKLFYEFLVSTHENSDNLVKRDLVKDGSDVTLLAPDMFADVYLSYLAMKCDGLAGDITSYNNNSAIFNSTYNQFFDWYHRTHTPLQAVSDFNV